MANVALGSIALALLWSVGAPARTVAIKTFKFRPDTVVVQAGDSVAWMNEDEIEHTVTADSAPPVRARFNGSMPGRGASYGVRFAQPGVYPYHCERHAFMRGVIRVTSTGEHP